MKKLRKMPGNLSSDLADRQAFHKIQQIDCPDTHGFDFENKTAAPHVAVDQATFERIAGNNTLAQRNMVRQSRDKSSPMKFIKNSSTDKPYCMMSYPETQQASSNIDQQLAILNNSLEQFRSYVDLKTKGAERYAARTRNGLLARHTDEMQDAEDIKKFGNHVRFRPDISGCGRREWSKHTHGTPNMNPVATPTESELRSGRWDRGMIMTQDNGRLQSCASPTDPAFQKYVRTMGNSPSNPYLGINELADVPYTDLPVDERGNPQPLSDVFLDSQFCLSQATADECGSAAPTDYPLSQDKTIPAHRCSWVNPGTAHEMCVPNAVKYKMRPSDRPGKFNPDDGYTSWFEGQVKRFVAHLQHEQEKYNRAIQYKGYGLNSKYVAPMIHESTLANRGRKL